MKSYDITDKKYMSIKYQLEDLWDEIVELEEHKGLMSDGDFEGVKQATINTYILRIGDK